MLVTDDLFKVHKCKPTVKWRQQFDNYLKTMPIYYAQVFNTINLLLIIIKGYINLVWLLLILFYLINHINWDIFQCNLIVYDKVLGYYRRVLYNFYFNMFFK